MLFFISKNKTEISCSQIGKKTDRMFIGTRKFDKIDQATGKHYEITEGIILSLVDNKVVDMRFDNKNMYKNIVQYLKTFTNKGHNYYEINLQNVSETISVLKAKIKEFTNIKRTYHKTTFGEYIKNSFTVKSNSGKKAYQKQGEKDFEKLLSNEKLEEDNREDIIGLPIIDDVDKALDGFIALIH